MSRDRSAKAILAAPKSGAFDDVGALLFAMRNMLEGALPPSQEELRHIYVLASMAEATWSRLDDEMTGAAK